LGFGFGAEAAWPGLAAVGGEPGRGRALGPGFGIGTGRDEPLGCGRGFTGAEPLGAGPGAGFGNAGPTFAPAAPEVSDARGEPRPSVAHATVNPNSEISERTVSSPYHARAAASVIALAAPRAEREALRERMGKSPHQAPATGSVGDASAARARKVAR